MHSIITDEAIAFSETKQGFNPNVVMAASLVSFTSFTLRICSDRKAIEISHMQVEVQLRHLRRYKRLKRYIN